MLSTLDSQKAVEDVQQVHMAQFANLPPELVGPVDGAVPATPGSTRPTLASDTVPFSVNSSTSTGGSTPAVAAALSFSDEASGGGRQKYAPIIIGLLSDNLLLALLLVAIGIVLYIQRSGRSAAGGKRTRHLDDVVAYPDVPSDNESLVTVDKEAPLSPASGFKKVINLLSPASAISIMRGISSFGGDAKRPCDGNDPKPPSKRRRKEVDLPFGSVPPFPSMYF
ncbi:hypothetical protein DFH08DRAFT_950822 [Mycena albidolilacea]|uniref:Transmembrane protein n=1 Tax=Mycena albidolilacea TaxID=1033008 RepID=A0AAD7ALU3_9AGAR|nr:hypothetical protein DFH08DRAFT_950822 [Mycena albidolilacea]